MKRQKINLLTYGLLVASVIGSVADRQSKTLDQSLSYLSTEAHHLQQGGDDDEYTVISTRFLFPERPKKLDTFH